MKILLPIALGLAVLLAWQIAVSAWNVPVYILPSPSAIAASFTGNFASLMGSLWVTLRITLLAFALALVSGVAWAIVFSQSRVVEMMLYPYAVVVQVTPIFAIAPLLIIWIGYERIELVQLILAWMAAFFPILSNTTLGLRSADHNLVDLFRLYRASRWQVLRRLRLPAAMPLLLAAMKTSGGLALIGTIIAEFAAGSGTASGLGWRILESFHRLETAKEFAALLLLAGLGIALFFALALLEHLVLRRWHESAVTQEQ